jgi:hypothetical protein
MNAIRLLAGAATTVTLLTAGIVPAVAKDGALTARGDCSGRTDWKLKVSPDNGSLEVEGEVDSNRAGQLWRWRLRHDGVLVARGSRVTGGASGSFDVRRLVANHSGTDTLVFRARRPATGEVCRAVVRF